MIKYYENHDSLNYIINIGKFALDLHQHMQTQLKQEQK